MNALVTCLLWATLSAPVEVKFQVLPPGASGQISSIGQVRYYLLNDFLKLAEFDAELYKLRLDTADLKEKAQGLKKELLGKDVIIALMQSDKDILSARALRLEQGRNECLDKLQKCSSPSIWPYVVAIAGGSAMILAGGYFWGVKTH